MNQNTKAVINSIRIETHRQQLLFYFNETKSTPSQFYAIAFEATQQDLKKKNQ